LNKETKDQRERQRKKQDELMHMVCDRCCLQSGCTSNIWFGCAVKRMNTLEKIARLIIKASAQPKEIFSNTLIDALELAEDYFEYEN